MEQSRYIELEKSGGPISVEEMKLGWHFCEGWDFMLVGPGMEELSTCDCVLPIWAEDEK